jgi:hypothetical protein
LRDHSAAPRVHAPIPTTPDSTLARSARTTGRWAPSRNCSIFSPALHWSR